MTSAWVPIFVKDRQTLKLKGMLALADRTEYVLVEEEGPLLPGPVSARVAVLDFDPKTGALLPGVPFRPARKPDGRGEYLDRGELEYGDPASICVSAFGTVYKTIRMFEQEDCLGRPIRWSFDGPQLLVVPRAGEWANAFYDRDSRSLQFFFFAGAGSRRTVFTAQSQDIVAHETAHAILDGIAPDLYHALTPQSLAIHEAVADLTAVIAATASKKLRRAVLQSTNGNLEGWNGFSAIAGEYGHAIDPGREDLRQLYERVSLRKVKTDEPHDLSVVLSGALYRVFLYMYDEIREQRLDGGNGAPEQAVAGPARDQERDGETPNEIALTKAGRRFKRTILRALDYLPPGEVSFADFGRAILASDQASHPDSPGQRDWLADEFVKRGVVDKKQQLTVKTMQKVEALRTLDLDALLESDYRAYEFAEENRTLLGIPGRIPFCVAPRLNVRKAIWHNEGKEEIAEVIFKVSWTEQEKVGTRKSPWPLRNVVHGATLAIDRPTRRARALLQSDRAQPLAGSRDRLLQRLSNEGALVDADEARNHDGTQPRGAVLARTVDGALRMRNTAHMLHFAREAHPAEGGPRKAIRTR